MKSNCTALLRTDSIDIERYFCISIWSLENPLESKMKSSVVENLPQPVVILKEIDDTGKIVDKGKVALGPKEDPKNYGDLFKDLSIVDKLV